MGLKTSATDALPVTDLWRKTGTISAGKPGNDAPTAGSRQPFNTSNSPNGISYAFIAWNTSISFQHAKPRKSTRQFQLYM